MEKVYSIICYSKWRFALMLCTSWLLAFPVTLIFYPFGIEGQVIIGLLVLALVLLPLFILPKYVAKGIVQIIVDTDSIQLTWIKSFLGGTTNQPIRFGFNEINSYKFEPSYNFDTLKIVFRSGRKLTLHRWLYDKEDDFNKFMTQFKRSIENYNKRKNTITPINKVSLIMENKKFILIIGIVIVLLIILTISFIITKGINDIKGIIPILVFIGPLIWVIIQIVKGSKMKPS